MVDIKGQVGRTGFFTGLDDDDDATVLDALLFQRQQRGDGREHGVTVISAATAIQLVALAQRHPRASAFGPAQHFRLLVEMAVHQDGARRLAGNLDEDQRRAAQSANMVTACSM
jgi:hypothetical protein